jgi:catecholate siderophore receptor
VDVDQPLNDSVAFRINGMYEDSDSYRDDVTLKRYGVNPTLTWRSGAGTKISFGVEYFHDERIADRGVSSFEGRPLDVDPSTFFGDPAQSPTHATVKMANAHIEHRFSETLVLRNRTRYGDYDKFYQNVFAGEVDETGANVALLAYNNATQRKNFFNQTDLNFVLGTGAISHKLLAGLELGRQKTNNFRNTGVFDSVAFDTPSISVPTDDPRTTLPVTFRQGPTDADNDGTAKIYAIYLQDEIALSKQLSLIAGLRLDRFEVDVHNNRTAATFRARDNLLAPRLGLVLKPAETLSLYASYSQSYQPRAGDQLASLSATNESLDPEEFKNYEIGAKWAAFSNLALTAALFRLERSNVAIPDPLDSTRSVLIDGQRNQGLEIGLAGNLTNRWSVIGTYTYQDGEIETDQSETVLKGATLANLPKNMFSLWNRYDISPDWSVGLGLIRKASLFASVENLDAPERNVVLPSFTRVDVAVYFRMSDRWRAQLNVENLLDENYFQFANSNTNITPASPRAARVVFTTRF